MNLPSVDEVKGKWKLHIGAAKNRMRQVERGRTTIVIVKVVSQHVEQLYPVAELLGD